MGSDDHEAVYPQRPVGPETSRLEGSLLVGRLRRPGSIGRAALNSFLKACPITRPSSGQRQRSFGLRWQASGPSPTCRRSRPAFGRRQRKYNTPARPRPPSVAGAPMSSASASIAVVNGGSRTHPSCRTSNFLFAIGLAIPIE